MIGFPAQAALWQVNPDTSSELSQDESGTVTKKWDASNYPTLEVYGENVYGYSIFYENLGAQGDTQWWNYPSEQRSIVFNAGATLNIVTSESAAKARYPGIGAETRSPTRTTLLTGSGNLSVAVEPLNSGDPDHIQGAGLYVGIYGPNTTDVSSLTIEGQINVTLIEIPES